MSLDEAEMNIWTGWPPRPVLTLYGADGVCLFRSCSARLDLADTIGPFFCNGLRSVLFGIRSDSTVKRFWTEERLDAQEHNIRYDLSHDGFCVKLIRLKGAELSCSEEAMWRLKISA